MVFGTLIERFFKLLFAPVLNPEMIWIVVPLLASMIMIEIYFGRYADEQLGWNSAVSNSLVLVFIGIDLFRKIFRTGPDSFGDIVASAVIFAIGIFLLYLNFYHKLPEKMAFLLSSVISVNMLAYLGLALVYTDVPLDIFTILSGILLIFVVWAVFQMIHQFETRANGI